MKIFFVSVQNLLGLAATTLFLSSGLSAQSVPQSVPTTRPIYSMDTVPTTRPTYSPQAGTTITMDGLVLVYNSPTKIIRMQITSAPIGLSSLLGSPMTLFKKDGGLVASGSASATGAFFLFWGFSYTSRAVGLSVTSSDPVHQYQQTPEYAALQKNLGADRAQELVLDIAAGWTLDRIAEKYIDDQPTRVKLTNYYNAEKQMITPKIASNDQDRDDKIDLLSSQRAILRLVSDVQNKDTQAAMSIALDQQLAAL